MFEDLRAVDARRRCRRLGEDVEDGEDVGGCRYVEGWSICRRLEKVRKGWRRCGEVGEYAERLEKVSKEESDRSGRSYDIVL